jgi:hypothetical protein
VRFVYRPEGADERSWDLDFETMKASEWISIEQKAGFTAGQFGDAIKTGSMLAIKALLWVLMKRSMSTLAWDSLDFSMAEIDIIEDDDADVVTEAESVLADPKA